MGRPRRVPRCCHHEWVTTRQTLEIDGPGDEPKPALRRVRRCTYCREWRDLDDYTHTLEGDHVIPESMGGTWIDHRVCGACNKHANLIGDELIAHDFLIRLLRSRHQVPDRNNNIPKPPVIAVPVNSGGVVKVALTATGPKYHAGMPPSAIERLELEGPTDQKRLSAIVESMLAPLRSPDTDAVRELARRGQPMATPPDAWSRFMAKIGLACGRDAYGDEWLDTREAKILSDDLLRGRPPRFVQRWLYPPVEPVWPFEPPKHRLWIHPSEETVILWVALFGEVIGAVPIGDVPAPDAQHTAWSLDPIGGTGEPGVRRTRYEAMHGATLAVRATRMGADVVSIPELGLVYIPDGPDGPVDLGVTLTRVESVDEAIEFAKRARSGS
jgi:hypothetical protein